jgi:hypothetical protein
MTSAYEQQHNFDFFAKIFVVTRYLDVLQQIICTIQIRRVPTRHDTIDFRPPIAKTSEILALSVVTGVGLVDA